MTKGTIVSTKVIANKPNDKKKYSFGQIKVQILVPQIITINMDDTDVGDYIKHDVIDVFISPDHTGQLRWCAMPLTKKPAK